MGVFISSDGQKATKYRHVWFFNQPLLRKYKLTVSSLTEYTYVSKEYKRYMQVPPKRHMQVHLSIID